MITREQCRAARGLLGWTQQDLANAAGLSKTAINNYERGLSDAKEDTLRTILCAFDGARISFIGSSGVQMREDTLSVIKGSDSYFRLLDDVCESLKDDGGELLVCNMSEAFEQKMLQADAQKIREYQKKMTDAGIVQRFLVKKGDHLFLSEEKRYRWIDDHVFGFGKLSFIYRDKMALKLWYDDMLLMINSKQASDAERERFEMMWKQASIPSPIMTILPESESSISRYDNKE